MGANPSQDEGGGARGLDPPLRNIYPKAGKRGSESIVWGGLLVREGFYGLTVVHK